MSCNGCRVLRKGCSEACVLRQCLQWIECPEAQGYATIFAAKFFGRAGLMSFISAVPENQRPGLFQSLLFEAAGRTVNPVNGAAGLLWTGNWHVCQAAVETVLRGGALKPIPDFMGGSTSEPDDCSDMFKLHDPVLTCRPTVQKSRRIPAEPSKMMQLTDLDLSLTPSFRCKKNDLLPDRKGRFGSPSMNSEESATTTCGDQSQTTNVITLLNLFN